MDKMIPLAYPLSQPQIARPSEDLTLSAQLSPVEGLNFGTQSATWVAPAQQPSFKHPPLFVQIVASETHLRCRPAELYLGASTTRGQMQMLVYFDENVYEHAVVQEWLGEVREATLWYLGRGTNGGATSRKAML